MVVSLYLREFDDLFWHPPANILWVFPASQTILPHDTPHPDPVWQATHHTLQTNQHTVSVLYTLLPLVSCTCRLMNPEILGSVAQSGWAMSLQQICPHSGRRGISRPPVLAVPLDPTAPRFST